MLEHSTAAISLESFDVFPERGFLPAHDPVATLGPVWPQAMNELAGVLPKLLAARQLRGYIESHPFALPSAHHPVNVDEYRCAARILSFAGHGYIWEDPQHPAHHLPAEFALAWQGVLNILGRPPVLSYASYALDNWRRLDPDRPIELGNIVLLQNFLGGLDEEWFVLVHVDIEAKAGSALAALVKAINASQRNQPDNVTMHLEELSKAEHQMCQTLLRMPERCDPYIYYNRVRPYIHGWKDNPALPEGVLYRDVGALKGPQHFRGETGAQSSIIPSLDAGLGVTHEDDPLRHYLNEMRDYMPPKHRAFIAALERLKDASGRGLLYGFVRDRRQQHPKLWNAFKDCVHLLGRFRETHLDYADRYIHRQSQRTATNPTEVGTGGTPFMEYLKKHLQETDRMIAD